ncbi:MAG: hypothetical protein Pars93KO_25530 [Parasphingorhabdus sp.]
MKPTSDCGFWQTYARIMTSASSQKQATTFEKWLMCRDVASWEELGTNQAEKALKAISTDVFASSILDTVRPTMRSLSTQSAALSHRPATRPQESIL